MRDEGFNVVATLMAKCRGIPNAFYGEVMAIRESLCLIQETQPLKIILESNAKEVLMLK